MPYRYRRSYRRRPDTLTGGTGDTNPQYMGGQITMVVGTGVQKLEVPIPVMRTGMSMSRAQVLECLAVDFQVSAVNATVPVPAEVLRMGIYTRNVTSFNTLSDPNLIAGWSFRRGAAGDYLKLTETVSTSDGAGHGVVIPTNSIWFLAQAPDGGATNTSVVSFRILFRFRNVGIRQFTALSTVS